MTQVVYRANLNAANFPFVSQHMGQSVIVRGQDGNYVPAVSSKADEDKDVGIPQCYYCHNVVPTGAGFSSVGYDQVAPATTQQDFSYVLPLRDETERRALLGVCGVTGKFFVLDSDDTAWREITTFSSSIGKLVTTAFVSGITYVYIEKAACYKYDFNTSSFVSVALLGLDTSSIIGLLANSGYLIVWSSTSIAWSSTVDVLDFVPSTSTGAGGGSLEGAKGAIVACVASVAGFIAYTTVNGVACSYSGNSRFPFNFREIIGCGGLTTPELAAVDGNNGVQYVYTTFGLQAVSFQQASAVFPELTDFLAGQWMEDFNESTFEFSLQQVTMLKKRLVLISGRYLIISYGIIELTHAVLYDIALKRYGKFKVTHVDCVEYNLPAADTYESAKKSIVFMQKNGKLLQVNTSYPTNQTGVLIMGKYQYTRSRMTQMESVELENIRQGAQFAVHLLSSIDGSNTTRAVMYLAENEGVHRKYLTDKVGKNHSVMLVGAFSVVSMVLAFNIHGRM